MEESSKPVLSKKKKRIIIGSIIAIIIVAVLLIYLLSPAFSPIASIRDTDGDGHADSNDAFPNDKLEWTDTDEDGHGDNSDAFPSNELEWNDTDSDGVGDNADFYDQGNGKVKISITSYIEDGTADFWTWGDPQFDIVVDNDGDGEPDDTYSSQIFTDTNTLTNPFSVTIDLPDNATVFGFSIWVWDSDTDDVWETIDYTPTSSDIDYVHTVNVPFSDSWTFNGYNDGLVEIDCTLSYSVSLTI